MTSPRIEIVEIISQKDLDDFIKLPYSIYSEDPLYVPPLIREIKKQFSDKNPFFMHATVKYFLAKKSGSFIGRIAAIINQRHIEIQNERAGFFGFFESINDKEVAAALLDKVSETLRRAGMHTLRGPMNFSTNEECGFMTLG